MAVASSYLLPLFPEFLWRFDDGPGLGLPRVAHLGEGVAKVQDDGVLLGDEADALVERHDRRDPGRGMFQLLRAQIEFDHWHQQWQSTENLTGLWCGSCSSSLTK